MVRPRPQRGSGFTLIELALVLAIVALFAALAVPSYMALVKRTHVAEARTLMEAMAHAQLAHFRDHGRFIACAPSGEAKPPAGIRAPFDATPPGWAELGFTVDGHVRYRYEVLLDGDSFVVVARGDLDANGRASRILLDGRTLQFTVEDELE